jgi:hypothetical protein
VPIWVSRVGRLKTDEEMNSILDKLEEARQAERKKILEILEQRFPPWVSTLLRKILREKRL